MLLSEVWKIFVRDRKLNNFSPRTLKGYRVQLNLLKRYFGNLDMDEFTLEGLKTYLIRKGMSSIFRRCDIDALFTITLTSKNAYELPPVQGYGRGFGLW